MTWTWTRKRKWITATSVAVASLMATAVVGRLMAAERLLEALRAAVLDRYGLEARADDVTLSLVRGTAVFENFRVLDGPVTVFEAARIEVDGRVLDVLERRFDCAKLTVLRPVVRIVVEADGRTNLRRILATPRKDASAPRPADLLQLREGTFEGGRVEFTDVVTDPGLPVTVVARQLRGTMNEWQFSGEPSAVSSGDFRADGEIRQPGFPARVSVVAWCSPPGGDPTWTLQAAVTGFDLRLVPQYVGAAGRAALGGDYIHVAVDIRSRSGVIGPGAVVGEVAGSGTVLPMRVGGTTSEPVFDAESPLATLLRIPLARAGRLGAVTLDAGWSVVKGGAGAVVDVGGGVVDAGVSLGTGLVNAGGEFLSGRPLPALAEAGAGVLGVFTSLGGGLLDGVGSLFGGGAAAARALTGADVAELDRQFGELHAARRLAMLRAALASAGGGGAKARHGRIAAEIGASSAGP